MQPLTASPGPSATEGLPALRVLLGAARLPHADLTEGHLTHFLVVRDAGALAAPSGWRFGVCHRAPFSRRGWPG